MRWIIIGGRGMLGTDLTSLLTEQGQDIRSWDREEIDITDPACMSQIADADVVVNCAAYTAVDLAEENEGAAFTLNATAPGYLARRCREIGARFVQISTDYVFSGTADTPYREDAAQAPAGAYGRTKAAGEWAVAANCDDFLVVRTAWLYGANGSCFPKTMARFAAEKDSLKVVADQYGQPTWTKDLSDLIYRMVLAEVPAGFYHGTSAGATNWYGFTQAIVESVGRDPQLVAPCATAEFPRPAPRPAYSVLGHDALRAVGVEAIGDWRQRWDAASGEVLGL